MLAMPRPRPAHLHREITRHGRAVWYFRDDKGPRIRLRSDYGSAAFDAEYQAALEGKPRQNAVASSGSLAWLIDRYRETTAWAALSIATRKQRERILIGIIKAAGKEPIARIDKTTIERGIERRSPAAGKHFLQTLRGLLAWAAKAGHIKADPTPGLKVSQPATDGHHTWTEEECAAFEARWPVGTRERVAYDVLTYTGLRRGDAVRLGRPHVKDGIATIRTEKTGEVVAFRILPPLQTSIDAGPVGELTFIAGERGRPMMKESFGTWFRMACKLAGVPGSAHGLRKAGATRAAENGATEAELDAMFGWRGSGMAALYTRAARRKKLSLAAADKMLTEREANIYSRTSLSGAGEGEKSSNKSKR